jgi:hypothetical protein
MRRSEISRRDAELAGLNDLMSAWIYLSSPFLPPEFFLFFFCVQLTRIITVAEQIPPRSHSPSLSPPLFLSSSSPLLHLSPLLNPLTKL